MTGTNSGLITVDVFQDGVALNGVAHLTEEGVGSYEYSVDGRLAQGPQGRPRVTLNLTPAKSAGAEISMVRAEGMIVSRGEMQGTWSGIQKKRGKFSLRYREALDPTSSSGPPVTGSSQEPVGSLMSAIQALPQNFRQALLMRCVLRALPLLGRMGNFDFWPDRAQTRRHLERIMRAVQAGLINCTANTARSETTAKACRTAFAAAQYALSAMETEQDGVKEVVGLAGLSSTAPQTLFTLGVVNDTLVSHFRDYSEARQAALDDLTALAIQAQSDSMWASPDFFRKRLWPGATDPKKWTADRAAFITALETVGLAEFSASYLQWAAQGLQPYEMVDAITSLEEWAERNS